MTREDKLKIIDYFDPWELVAFLQVRTEDVVDAFEDEVEDLLEDLLELMGLRVSGADDTSSEDD